MIHLARTVYLIITIYLMLIFVRFILAFMRPSMFNPIVRFVYNATDPYLRLFAGLRFLRIGNIDFTPILALYLLYLLRGLSYNVILTGYFSLAILLNIVIELIFRFVYFFIFIFIVAVGLRFIFEAIGLRTNNVFISIIYSLSEPAVRPVREMIKLGSRRGFDPAVIISLACLVFLRVLLLPKLLKLINMLMG
ncbi:MAG: YggT family protein [Spirochaetes bacterium]|nr:YggT family protein [Spirochaetota bacterium]